MLETITVLSILIFLMAGLWPAVMQQDQEANEAAAAAGVSALAESLRLYERDTGMKPCGLLGSNQAHVLVGPGSAPSYGSLASGTVHQLITYVMRDDMAGAAFGGPYLDRLVSDPWGRSYVVNSHGYFSTEHVWVLSAGLDGQLQTAGSDLQAGGDDIGVILE